jgi:tRNA-uridine 2-sulfurtransferase
MPDERRRPARVLGLISGGLDSTLAARLLRDQGLEVEGVHFATGFCKIDHRRVVDRSEDRLREGRLRNEALHAGAELEIPVEIVDVADEYLREVVLRPKYGYGSAMNPCIDCRIFMLRKAREMADARGAEVVFTGEVVGQRPMSQHHASLRTIEQESGLEDRLLRPLSAAHLPPTRAEREGRVDRSRLEAIHGRTRRGQFDLAARFAIRDYPTPSGGCCFLADENFGRRMRDLLAHHDPERIGREDLLLLKVGRHFRLAHDLKVVMGRDEPESTFLRLHAGDRWTCQVADGAGSYGVVEGDPLADRAPLVASVAARYSRHRANSRIAVRLERRGEVQLVETLAASESSLEAWRL